MPLVIRIRQHGLVVINPYMHIDFIYHICHRKPSIAAF